MSEPKISELEFLRKLQRLLNEGDFSATYKFALLNALADLSVEGEIAADGSLRVPVDAIAAKFLEYYWPQARPYRSLDSKAFVLRQNAGRQALVIKTVASLQEQTETLGSARRSPGWNRAIRRVAANIVRMPLWKLQRVGGESDEFLYRRSEFADGSIRLLPGVPRAFRALYGLVLDAVRGAWVRRINQFTANHRLLEDSDLASFLFGAERSALGGFARVLRAHQHARCLYCRRPIRSGGDVDHFIAWARYPVDLGHNLVLAHAACNNGKRDFLAHPRHVESWYRSHIERSDELSRRLAAAKLPYDAERTRAVAWWAYEQGERAGAHAWIEKNHFEKLDPSWRDAMGIKGLARVAEREPPGYLAE